MHNRRQLINIYVKNITFLRNLTLKYSEDCRSCKIEQKKILITSYASAYGDGLRTTLLL